MVVIIIITEGCKDVSIFFTVKFNKICYIKRRPKLGLLLELLLFIICNRCAFFDCRNVTDEFIVGQRYVFAVINKEVFGGVFTRNKGAVFNGQILVFGQEQLHVVVVLEGATVKGNVHVPRGRVRFTIQTACIQRTLVQVVAAKPVVAEGGVFKGDVVLFWHMIFYCVVLK